MSELQPESLLPVLDRKSSQMEGKQLPHREDEKKFRFKIKVALWDLLTALEDSDDEFLKEIVGSTDFVAKARSVMIRLDSCCGPVPAVEAMHNDIILDEVFKHSDVDDLLQFRLVNKQWHDSATKILAQEKSLKISITGSMVNVHCISDIIQDFERLKRVPITTLELNVDFWVSHGLLHQFTMLHGRHIKKIILSGGLCMHPNQFVGFLHKLLNTDFPRVEHLVFSWNFLIPDLRDYGDPNEDLIITTGQVPLLLRSVKTMSFEACVVAGEHLNQYRLLVMLLRAAENLETFIGPTNSLREIDYVLMALQTTHKQGTLKEAQLNNSNCSPHTLRLLAEMNPKLKIFEIRKCPIIEEQTFSHSVVRILESSRDILTHLTIYAFCDISREQMGVLPNLKYLYLYCPRYPNVHQRTILILASIFPNGAVWSETFPKLKTLELELNNFDKKSVNIYFPADNFKDPEGSVDTSLTVTTLKLECRFTQFGLKALARKFPNVQSIQAKNYKEFFLNEESVWLSPWNRLEHLELGGFDVCQTFCSRSLDSFFTGFSDSICDKLRQIPEDRNDNLVHFDLRVITSYPSVRDLHNLRKLKIVFQNSKHFMLGKNVEQDGSPESLGISYVTAKYAFNVMPLLQVTIAYDQSHRHSKAITQLLKPLSSYGGVTLVHEPQK